MYWIQQLSPLRCSSDDSKTVTSAVSPLDSITEAVAHDTNELRSKAFVLTRSQALNELNAIMIGNSVFEHEISSLRKFYRQRMFQKGTERLIKSIGAGRWGWGFDPIDAFFFQNWVDEIEELMP